MAEARWSGGCSEAQGALHSRARRGGRSEGFVAAVEARTGSREAAGGLYKAAANLGVRARVWKAGVDSAGDSGRAIVRGRRTC